jgi:hypothetical protein
MSRPADDHPAAATVAGSTTARTREKPMRDEDEVISTLRPKEEVVAPG